jgi:hypothetical protein
MDDEELRAMIRASIARHLGSEAGVRGSSFGAASGSASFGSPARAHASHALLPLLRGGDEGDGLCLIEPTVRCNHCGYCLSYGH